MKKRSIALTASLLLLWALILLRQWQEGRRLTSENARLRATAMEPEAMRDTNPPTTWLQAERDELETLRKEHAELLRLRAEVSQLRRQIKDGQLASSENSNKPAGRIASGEDPAAPVERYVVNLRATVPWQHTLVTGGWKLPSGKHAVFFVEPRRVNAAGNEDYDMATPGQILLETRIAEIPEEALVRLGLDSLKSDRKDTDRQMLLTGAEAESVLRALEETSGVDLLHTPKVTTLDGRQAQIKVAQNSPAGEGPEGGPSVDFMPHVLPGGEALDLRLSAHLSLLRH